MEKGKEPTTSTGADIPAPPAVQPELACEREVAGYTDEFTLSGGCCSGDQ